MRLIDVNTLLTAIRDFQLREYASVGKEKEYDVLDKVLKLIESLSESASVGDWISVEERLPEDNDGSVIAIVNGKPSPNITLKDAYLLAEYCADEGWIVEPYYECKNLDVTYWMPLPEPPKERENK